jgi:N-formylglutamate deformylase
LILHIPHASKEFPSEVRNQIVLSDQELTWEIIRVTDSFTDELFNYQNASRIVFPVNRLLVDPERFLDDDQEPMAAVGMGVVYTKTSQGLALRYSLSNGQRKALIDQYYIPHHDKIALAVKSELDLENRCLIVDCHSFPSNPLPCETDQSPQRPDICIGTDEFHTPDWLSEAVDSAFKKSGFRTKLNSPYPGTIVPLPYYQIDPSVFSIMIEIKRSLYMDEKTALKNTGFGAISKSINSILTILNELFVSQKINPIGVHTTERHAACHDPYLLLHRLQSKRLL